MENQTDPLFLLYSIALAQFLLFGLIAFKKKNIKRSEFLLLMLLIASMTLIVLDFILTWSGYLAQMPQLLGISYSFIFLLGPILYGLISIAESKKLSYQYLFHFIPFVLASLYNIFSMSFISDKLEFYQNEIATEQVFTSLPYITETVLKACSILIYVIWARLHMNKNAFTWKTINKIIWQVYLIVGVLLLIHSFLLFFHLPFYALTYCVIISLFGLLGFWLNWTLVFPSTSIKADKYQKSGLSEAILSKEAQRIQEIMNDQKPYLNPNLKLSSLSEITGLSTHHLSQIINQAFDKNYSDFINEYRVDYAKSKLLEIGEKLTIQEVAFESGFNSKNSFNRSFKKILGVTPTDFRLNSKNR